MSDLLNFDNSEQELLDFNTSEDTMPDSQRAYEYKLQQDAGIEPSADFEGVRNSLAAKHKDEEDAELYQTAETLLVGGADPAKVQKAVADYKNVYNSSDASTSLEVEAGRKKAEKALADNPNTFENAMYEGYSPEDFAIKEELANEFFARAKDYVENGNSWTKTAGRALMSIVSPAGLSVGQAVQAVPGGEKALARPADMIANAIPFFTTYDVATVGDADGIEISSLSIGERQKAEFLRHKIYDTPQQFGNFLQSLADEMDRTSPTAISMALENINGYIDTSNDYFNLLDTIDAFGVLRGLKGGAKSAVRWEKIMGDEAGAVTKVVDAVKEGTDTATILEDAATMSAAQPFQGQGLVSTSNKIKEEVIEVATDKDLQRRIAAAREGARLTADEEAVAKTVISDNARRQIDGNNASLVDVQAVEITEDPFGIVRARVSIGGGLDGKIGMTKKAAENLAHKMQLTPDEYTINLHSGQGYYIDVDRAVKSDEFALIGADTSPVTWAKNAFNRTFGGTLNVSNKMHQKDIAAHRAQLGLEKYLRDTTMKLFSKLGHDEQKAFVSLVRKGQDGLGSWTTKEALMKEGFSEAIADCYMAYKKAEDTAYYIENLITRKRMVADNYKMLNNELIVKPVNVTENNFRKIRVKDYDNYDKLKAQLDKGFKVAEVHRSSASQKRLKYTHVLIDPSKDVIAELPEFVTPYQAGGRRGYTWGTMFVKMGTMMDNGINGFARTLKAGTDRKILEEYASEVNKLVEIMKNNQSIVEQTRLIQEANFKHLNIDNASDAKKLIRTEENPKGIFDPNYTAQVMEDGEMYKFGNENPSVYDGTERLHDALDDLVRMREETYDGRGVLLDQVNGEAAKILNVRDVWDNAVRRAAKIATVDDLHTWYQREFRRQFGDKIKDSRYLSDQELINVDISNKDIFTSSKASDIAAAKNFQQHYQRIVGAKTGLDRTIESGMQSFARWVGDKHLLGLSRDSKILRKFAKTDPIGAVRTVEAYNVMALNFSQLWKQGLDLIATGAAHPIDFFRGLVTMPAALHAMHFRHLDKNVWKGYVGYGKMLGVDMERLADYLDTMASTQLVGKMDPVLYKQARGGWFWSHLGSGLTAPFQIAQGSVNVLSDIIAFLGNQKGSFAEIAQHADDITRNMTSVSQSAFQYGQKTGITKLAAQWSGYKTHTLEAMFNKRLTLRERASIAFTSLIGLGGISNISEEGAVNAYKWLTQDADVDPDIAEGIGWGILHELGKDFGIDFNESLGFGEDIAKISDLLSSDVDSRTKVKDLFPFIAGVGGVYSTVNNVYKMMSADGTDAFDMYRLSENFATDPNAPAGIKNMAKAFVMWKTGMYFNTHRQPLEMAGYPIAERGPWVWKTLFGIAPYERWKNDFAYNSERIRTRLEREAFDDLREKVRNIKAFEDSSTEDPITYEAERNTLYNAYETARRGYAAAFADEYGNAMANDFMYQTHHKLWKEQEAGDKYKKGMQEYENDLYQQIYGDNN